MTEESLKPYVIGLDLGGTNSVFGIVDSRGDIKATTAIKTQGYGNNVQAYVDAAVDALQIIIDQVAASRKSRQWASALLTATTITAPSSLLRTSSGDVTA